MPDAKIELLIRKPGPEGGEFRIEEVPSGQVYAGYRPRRIQESGYEAARQASPVDGRSYYVLKAHGGSKYLSLNDREYFLWRLMDGTRSIKDIAAAYFFEFGRLDFEAIRKLLAGLREAGLVEFVPASRLRVALDGSERQWAKRLKARLAGFDYRLDDADGWVGRLYARGGSFFVGRFAMALYVVLSITGVYVYARHEDAARFPFQLIMEHPLAVTAAAAVLFYPVAALHELFHALACKRFGRKVYAFGFTLWDGFYPSFYTDVSDIYLSPRPERIYVSLAGPLSTTAIAAAFLLAAAVSPGAPWAFALYEMGRFCLLLAFISLYPFQFIKMDGYYLLVDLLGFPSLRERTFAFMKGLPAFVRSRKRPTRAELIMSLYFAGSLVSVVLFGAFFFGSI